MDYKDAKPGDIVEIKAKDGVTYDLTVVSTNVVLGLLYVKDSGHEYVINWIKNTMCVLFELVEGN